MECLDFDDKGSCYATWAELVEAEAPGLLSRLTVEQSPSGGFHVTYLCPEAVIDGNTKLAARGPDDDLIETRGEGGYFLCAPSPGYKLLQGNHRELATVTPKERRIMWGLARSFNEYIKPSDVAGDDGRQWRPGSTDRPGDAFNADPDPLPRDMLLEMGWTPCGGNGKYEHFTRPGKERGVSGSLIDGRVFYPFTSNAGPLEAGKGYSPFALFALAYFDGDFRWAAKELFKRGYGRISPPEDSPEPEAQEKKKDDGKANPWAGIDFMAYRAKRYLETPPPPMDFVFSSLRAGNLGIIVGPPGSGKTHLVQHIAGCIATGDASNFGGLFTVSRKGRVVIISAEDDEVSIHDRVYQGYASKFEPFGDDDDGHTQELINDIKENLIVFPALGMDARFVDKVAGLVGDTANYRHILQQLKKVPDLRLVVFDPLVKFYGGDENDNAMADFFCTVAVNIAQETGAAVLLPHHTVKGFAKGKGNKFELATALHQDAARGASGFTAAAAWVFNLVPLPKDAAEKYVGVSAKDEEYLAGRISKNRFGKKGEPVFFHVLSDGMLDVCEQKYDPEAEKIEIALRDKVYDTIKLKEESGDKLITSKVLAEGYHKTWKEEVPGITIALIRSTADLMVSEGILHLVERRYGKRSAFYLATTPDAGEVGHDG